MRRWSVLIVGAAFIILVAGCTSTHKGAAIGGATGGVVGGVIGHQTGHTTGGAVIGAGVGAVTGGVIGHQMDKRSRGDSSVVQQQDVQQPERVEGAVAGEVTDATEAQETTETN